MYHNNSYLKKKRNKIELLLRLFMGLQQLIYRPYKNLCFLALVGLFSIVWKCRYTLFGFGVVPKYLTSIYQYLVAVMLLIALVLFLLLLIKQIGCWSSKRDEGCLIVAFKPVDLRNGYPILISKRKLKGTDVVRREFYTMIPKNRWEELQEEMADSLNVTFVKPCIEYGGKRKDKSYRMVIYTTPNRRHKERGILYDEEF